MTFSTVLGPNIPVLEPAQRPPPTKTWFFSAGLSWGRRGASSGPRFGRF